MRVEIARLRIKGRVLSTINVTDESLSNIFFNNPHQKLINQWQSIGSPQSKRSHSPFMVFYRPIMD